MHKKNIIIIHPGVQHAYRLANALVKSALFNRVTLCTWFLLKSNGTLSGFNIFRKRVKDIDANVNLHIFPLFEILFNIQEKIFFTIFPQKKNSNYNNIQYLWSYLFGCLLIPYIYFNKKNTLLVLYDTSGWPLSYYAKKWGIPVIMDFPSISHESAIALGITETGYGIEIKIKERQLVDWAIYCSDFAKATYQGKSSATFHYTAHVGATLPKIRSISNINHQDNVLHIAFIANMELRKGLDFLLEATSELTIPFKLHLIGKISKNWVIERINPTLIGENKVCFAGPFDQKNLIVYLKEHNIQLNILPSRFDSFGMVVPETMMLGIPNIVSPFVGAGEKIMPEESGFIMQELSASEIRKNILKYYYLPVTDKVLLSKNTYERSKQISWEQYDIQINEIFKDILSQIKPKIAFIVTHPTQFEVPFYQYIKQYEQEIDFEVVYINANDTLHYDKEIQRNIDWGFNLLEGYKYTVLNKNNIRNEIKSKIKAANYDLIITNGYNGPYLKIIDILYFQTEKLALRIDSIARNQPFGWKLWKRPILSLLFTQFSHFLAVSSFSKKYLKSHFVPEKKINFFSYSIDENRFKNVSLHKVNDLKNELQLETKKVFLCVSKLIQREIPIDTIKAFIANNNIDWVLLIVGDGKDKNELIKFCAKYPKANIRFLGYLPYTELAAYYHLADVFIHSVLEENWGVSVHEAIASNCTVITSDTVGSSYDLIEQGKNGYTYPFRSVDVLKEYMKQSLQLDPRLKLEINQIKLREWGYPKMWKEIKSLLD